MAAISSKDDAVRRRSLPRLDPFRNFWLRIFDRYQNPIFIIDQQRHLIFRNGAAANVVSANAGFSERAGKLLLGHKADLHLDRILAGDRELVALGTPPCRGVRVERSKGSRDWLVLVHRLDEAPYPEAGRRMFLLQAIGRIRPRVMPPLALHDLFGLTKREMAVVVELLRGGTAQSAAQRLCLSKETVRSHLRCVFLKCDVHSKTELIALLQYISQFVPACEPLT